MKAWKVINASLLLLAADRCFADVEQNRLARYSVTALPTASVSADPLTMPVDIQFSPMVITTEQALVELLTPSGYRLASTIASCPSYASVLAWPLPAMHRHLVAPRLDHALELLAGPAHYVVFDPVHRLVSFELREAYSSFSHGATLPSFQIVAPTIQAPRAMKASPEPAIPKRAQGRYIGPIEEATSLQQVVDEILDDYDTTPEQLMLALFAANPGSFCFRNVNCLRRGTTLTVPPDDDIARQSQRAAKRILHQHYVAWRLRVHRMSRNAVTPKEVMP
jgi:type IV pili sensor histidine kinase/response regulator